MSNLPMNDTQKLMSLALSGVAPQQHDKHVNEGMVLAAQNGDSEAMWSLMQEYVDVLSVILHRPTKPPRKAKALQKLWANPSFQDYEDLFQESLLEFIILVNEYHPERGSFERYVRAKLHQRVFDRFFSEYLATQINEIEFDEKIKSQHEAMEVEDEEDPKLPAQYLELYQALNKLTSRQRQVIELSVFKKWNSTEVGNEIGISPATVRVTLKKALKKLRNELEESSYGEEKLLRLPSQLSLQERFQRGNGTMFAGRDTFRYRQKRRASSKGFTRKPVRSVGAKQRY
ncbi:RNA polymerase sigma factor [Bacillus phage DZ1]|uniref:RNA polymerase sigma factor n=1 Tax=Bacillus phage DZ1 TaxID=3075862 RepID=A0AA96EJM9_9CAUD|nr:RNA polymerase sigma factor [Bacillus phage DZ1]